MEKDKPQKRDHQDVEPENCKGQCGYTPWCKDCEKPETITKK